jgi:choline monooxygenase
MQDLNPMIRQRIRDAREALSRPTHLAEGLEGLFYGEEFYAIEQRTLFPRSWCAVGVGAAIAEPGDMLPIDLAGWPVLLVRGQDRQIRAFHNICRHRAMKLVGERCSHPLIRCPWHSWSYNLKGDLLATPEIGGAGSNTVDGFDKANLGLKSIPVGMWLDYIFINLDGRAPPFAEHIGPAVTLLDDLNLHGLRHGGRLDEMYAGNWKLSTEGGIEDYHLPFGHPQLQADAFRNTTACFADRVYTGGWVDMRSGAAGGEVPPARPSDSAALPPILTRQGGPADRMLVLNVFPTGTILIDSDHVMVGVLLPQGPARTKVELHFYYRGEAATSPAAQSARDGKLSMWREVLPQDFPFIEGTQATVHVRDAAGIRTRFSPYWEQAVLQFQRMVLDAVAGGIDAVAAGS